MVNRAGTINNPSTVYCGFSRALASCFFEGWDFSQKSPRPARRHHVHRYQCPCFALMVYSVLGDDLPGPLAGPGHYQHFLGGPYEFSIFPGGFTSSSNATLTANNLAHHFHRFTVPVFRALMTHPAYSHNRSGPRAGPRHQQLPLEGLCDLCQQSGRLESMGDTMSTAKKLVVW